MMIYHGTKSKIHFKQIPCLHKNHPKSIYTINKFHQQIQLGPTDQGGQRCAVLADRYKWIELNPL